jgi:ribonuclease P protein component
MVPQKSRLPREEFKAGGYKTIQTPFFSLKTKRNELGHIRIGVIIGKAVHKEAAKRNFWKRQARSTLLELAKGNNDLLMIFLPGKKSVTKKQFKEELSRALIKTK